LERLGATYHLAIFTGRLHDEADFSLGRFVPGLHWAHIVADDDVTAPKPAPDGLLAIAAQHPGAPLIYVGDTVDDARSGRAAAARFIGIADSRNPRRDELIALLKAEGAVAVLENINQLETVL
jgi:HAD superfamily phosphatase